MSIGAIGVYLLEVSILLILLYIFNKQLLSRETFHRLNRFSWLTVVAASFLLPLIAPYFAKSQSVAIEGVMPITASEFSIADIYSLGIVEASDNTNIAGQLLFILAIVYLIGVIALFIYNIFNYCSLVALVSKRCYHLNRSSDERDIEMLRRFREYESELCIKDNVCYIVHNQNLAPFSWFNFVVVSRDDLKKNSREIVTHELSHIAQHHSVDVLLLNSVTTILWFNPAAWLTKQALQQVHEYCADESVLSLGIDAKEYQLLLIRKAVGERLYTISNNLNHSNLKNRITMMLKKKSPRRAAVKYLYAVPVAITAIALFASPALAKTTSAITEAKVKNYFTENKTEIQINEQAESINSTTVVIKNGKTAVEITSDGSGKKSYVSQYPIDTAKESITYLINDKQVDEQTYKELNPERFEIISELIDKCMDENDSAKGEALHSTAKNSGQTNEAESRPLHIVDGKVVDKSVVDNITPERISQISVVKDPAALAKYDNSGNYNGIIEITLQEPETAAKKPIKEGEEDSFFLLINGEEVDYETFKNIDSDKVLEVVVDKEKGKVINLTLKEGETIASAQKSTSNSKKEDPLIYTEVMPTFKEGKGDLASFRDWVMMRLRYPEQAAKDKIQGRVVLSFVVEEDGSIVEVSKIGSPNDSLFEEAKRVVLSSSGMWNPAVQKGKKVRVSYMLPVVFKITGEEQSELQATNYTNSIEPIT